MNTIKEEFIGLLDVQDSNIRKHIKISIDAYFSRHNTYLKLQSIDDRCDFIVSLFNLVKKSNLDYDVKIIILNNLYIHEHDIVEDDLHQFLMDDDLEESQFEKYIEYEDKKSYEDVFNGDCLLCSYKEEILVYLDSLGYDISNITDKKSLLKISFTENFLVEYYPIDRKTSPYFCKTAEDVKHCLKNGQKLDIFYKIVYGFNIKQESEIYNYDDLIEILKTHNRIKLKNSDLPSLSNEEKIELSKLDLPFDIKIFLSKHYFIDKELMDLYLNPIVEIENNNFLISELEKIGYTTIYTEFKKLYLDMEYFELYNDNNGIIKTNEYEIKKIDNDELKDLIRINF